MKLEDMTPAEVAAAIDQTCNALALDRTNLANRGRALQVLMDREAPPEPDSPVTIVDQGQILNDVKNPTLRRSLGEHARAVRSDDQRIAFASQAYAAVGRGVAAARDVDEAAHAIGRRDGLDLRRRADFAEAMQRVLKERPDLVPTWGSRTPPPPPATPLCLSEPLTAGEVGDAQAQKDERDAQFLLKLDETHAAACAARGLHPNVSPEVDRQRWLLRLRLADELKAGSRR